MLLNKRKINKFFNEESLFFKNIHLLGLISLWLLACVLTFFHLGDLPLRDFDEATVARVSFELSNKEGINQLMPTLWGDEYLNKAPGLHWLISYFIKLNQFYSSSAGLIPSEFIIRCAPAFLSTLVVPLGGLIQAQLLPKDRTASFATAGILLTLLPIVRTGRLAMLDGTQLSAFALFWFFLISLEQTPRKKLFCFSAGLVGSVFLLLKAPLLLPAITAAIIPIFLLSKRINLSISLILYFLLGLIPGASWHFWHISQRGIRALWLWGGDGATRVLFDAGEGSDLGFLVPLIELLEGSWPWLLLLPFGIFFALNQRHTKWGQWVLSMQFILLISILPLKTQLPWYSHPLWLPFSLLCGVPLSWLINRAGYKHIFSSIGLTTVPYACQYLGLLIVILALLGAFNLFQPIAIYSHIAFIAGLSWFVGGFMLSRALKHNRIMGAITIFSGSFCALLLLMGSNFWLWELNENWPVKPVSRMVSNIQYSNVFIDDFERPSLNWYGVKKIRSIDEFSSSSESFVLTRSPLDVERKLPETNCRLVKNRGEWSLMLCSNQ